MFLAPANEGDEEACVIDPGGLDVLGKRDREKDLNFYIQIDEDEGYIISYRTNSTALGLWFVNPEWQGNNENDRAVCGPTDSGEVVFCPVTEQNGWKSSVL